MSSLSLSELLEDNSPIVADGSMATSLYEEGFYINRSFEEISLKEPASVQKVTTDFKSAGSKILHTNTFSAIRPKLVTYNIQDRHEQILRASAEITLKVSAGECLCAGAIGPLGLILEPLGPTSIDEAKELFAYNAKIFDETGLGAISLLNFHDLTELEAAIDGCRSASSLPIIASVALQEGLKTSFGHTIEEFARLMRRKDVEVVGFSGEIGPSGMLTAMEKIEPLVEKPVMILPNAGLPRYVNDQYIYLCNPDYMGKFAKRLVQAGARIVGGHSGVYADHIRAIANNLKMAQVLTAEPKGAQPAALSDVTDEPKPAKPLEQRSELGRRLVTGEPIISIEIVPPKGIDFEKFLQHCETIQKAGIKFVNIPDGARATARMSSLQLSSYVANRFDLEPIPHFTARDRNLIGLQSDLLGCYVNGVRNVLLVTGDPPKLGNCPGATAVYDVDAIGLTHITRRMNEGLDLGGSSFGRPTEFCIGVALNPTASHRELEIKRFKYKIEAGADFAITQPIYDIDAYKRFFDDVGGCDLPIVMGIWPLVSLRNAEFLKNEVPGVVVPDWALKEMEKADGDKEESLKRGLEIAARTMDAAKDLVKGFQVSAPFNRVTVALEALGLK